MPIHYPINASTPIQASRSDLVAFRWRSNGISADFVIPADESRLLRVSFDRQCIVRLLDEMPLSTEEDDGPNEGLVADHFAYRIEGSRFARTQSSAWKETMGPVSHYQFITGWGCMDVLSGGEPSFAVVAREVL
ncbi:MULTISPECIES: hypothetical protein [unclassified Phenylobacterium]|jgi:hypothetical protein|uniref:hypothetical protein n=1 Tax=unclassified Phenylobacterium TaxID=2640670 RepID=UPI00083B6846|nr:MULTISPECIES: hypothetical protein [unclassified Phenylobacterium]